MSRLSASVGETRYTKDHEWVSLTKSDEATVGITDFAQSALGDVVFIDLPEVGAKFEAGEAFGSVESVKAASSVYAPVSMTIAAVNQALKDDNSLINRDAEKEGWMIKVKLNQPKQVEALMDKASYEQLLKDAKH
jgi:glycine cleavage system H protein